MVKKDKSYTLTHTALAAACRNEDYKTQSCAAQWVSERRPCVHPAGPAGGVHIPWFSLREKYGSKFAYTIKEAKRGVEKTYKINEWINEVNETPNKL